MMTKFLLSFLTIALVASSSLGTPVDRHVARYAVGERRAAATPAPIPDPSTVGKAPPASTAVTKAPVTTQKPATPPPPPPPKSTAPAGGNLPGLNALQSSHVREIIAEQKARKLPIRACEVAIATAITESNIHVFASSVVPASLKCPFDKGFIGKDHDSVGIFQQRVQFFGKDDVCKPMDPRKSAGIFFDGLVRLKNFQAMSIGDAAQAVQRSAFPERYQTHAAEATKICQAGGA